MKYFLLSFLICLSAQAEIKVQNGEVLPFSYTNYPLKSFVKEFAELMNVNVSYPAGTIDEKDRVFYKLNAKVSTAEFKKIFLEILDNFGLTGIEEDGVIWLSPARDIRYMISEVYIDNKFPKDASFSMVLFTLKHPLSSEIARNLRPFMSRYGRVIDFSDGKTILMSDQGTNIERLIETIKFMDTGKAYQSMLSFVPKPDPDETHPLQEKVMELEVEKKILEKKYMNLKEEHLQ